MFIIPIPSKEIIVSENELEMAQEKAQKEEAVVHQVYEAHCNETPLRSQERKTIDH